MRFVYCEWCARRRGEGSNGCGAAPSRLLLLTNPETSSIVPEEKKQITRIQAPKHPEIVFVSPDFFLVEGLSLSAPVVGDQGVFLRFEKDG